MDATAFVSDTENQQAVQDYQPIMQQLQTEYPVLKNLPLHVRSGVGLEQPPGAYSETYAKGQEDNPAPDFHTIAIFDRSLQSPALKKLLLGETFHVLGGLDAETQQPRDKTWFGFKQRFMDSLTPDQIETDLRDYSALNRGGVTYPSMAHYYQANRLDAYFRGYLSPMTDAEQQDWGRTYTPEQKKILGEAQNYLKGKE